jgi:hypothetical protein
MTFQWFDGNGAVPFPGRRVQRCTRGPYKSMKTYELHEYLGNETVVSYRLIFNNTLPEDIAWMIMENDFRSYILEALGEY